MSLKLFYAPGACSLASHIALNEAGAEFEPIRVNFGDAEQRKPKYLAINPKGRVPALVTDEGILTENPAILDWIARRWPDAGLVSLDDPWAAAQVLSFNTYIASSLHPAFAHLFRPERYSEEAGFAAIRARAPGAIEGYFDLAEAQLSDGPWVHGQRYTTSDPYLYVMTRWFLQTGPDRRERYPFSAAHLERMQARGAVLLTLETEGLTTL